MTKIGQQCCVLSNELKHTYIICEAKYNAKLYFTFHTNKGALTKCSLSDSVEVFLACSSLFSSRHTIQKVQSFSPLVKSKRCSSPARGWAHADSRQSWPRQWTIREAVMTNSWTGSQLGQMVYGVFQRTGDGSPTTREWRDVLFSRYFCQCERY